MKASIGRIVRYHLTEQDAEQINRRRTTGESIADRIIEAVWPVGAQAHIGNVVQKGDPVAAIIVAVFGDDLVNAQALLDGTDALWLTSVSFSIHGPDGTWDWPPQV